MWFLLNPHLWAGGLRGALRRIRQDAKAARRGEVRIAPGQRGRIYAKRDEEPAASGGDVIAAPVDRSATMSLTIIRADGTREPGPTVPAIVTMHQGTTE